MMFFIQAENIGVAGSALSSPLMSPWCRASAPLAIHPAWAALRDDHADLGIADNAKVRPIQQAIVFMALSVARR